jgi:trimeric autotransporter adhesin
MVRMHMSRDLIGTAQGIGVAVIGGGNMAYKYLGVLTGTNMPNFVVVSPSSGTTPNGVWVALNPNVVPYLIPHNYELTLQFGTPNQTSPPYGTAIVKLNLIGPQPPTVTATVSAASLQPAISPGQIVSIFGTHLSTPPITAQFDSAGLYPASLGNTRVTFNGVAAPLLYVSTTQINAQVPYEVAGQKSVNVVITHNAAASPPFSMPILDTSPGIFTRHPERQRAGRDPEHRHLQPQYSDGE